MQLAAAVSQLRDKLADHCDIVAGLEASGSYQSATPHSSQDVFQLAQAIGRIDVDQNQTSFRRCKLHNCPFRAVRRPDADAIAWLEAESQKPRREGVRARLELRIGPATVLVRNDQRFARPISHAHFVQKSTDSLADQRRATIAMHVTFALHECLPSITKSWTTADAHQSCAVGSFSFEDERWRFNVLVEGVRRVRKAALSVGTVVELHRDVEHHKIRGGYTSTRPSLEQGTRRGVRPGRPCRELPDQCSCGC